jgi:O-antigen ligase
VFVAPKLALLWAELALALAVAAAAILTGRALDPAAVRPHPADVAVALLAVLSVAAWAASSDPRQSLYGERLQYQGLLTALLYAGLYAVARVCVVDIRGLRHLAVACAAGGTLVAAYALVQRAGLDPVWHGYLPEGRVFSSIGQPNALAAYLVMVIPVTAALLMPPRAAVRAAVGVGLAAMVLALMFTLSRAGYLAFVATLPVMAAAVPRRSSASPRALALGVGALVCAAVAAFALIAPTRDAVARSWDRATSSTDVAGDASLRFHLDAWNVAARIAADHPLLGTGPETFPDVFPEYSHRVLPPDRAAALDAYRVESPHNVYLAIASGSGIPALVAYLAAVAAALATITTAARRAPTRAAGVLLVAILAASAGHLVTDAFMTAEVTGTALFWILIGAGLGVAGGWTRSTPALTGSRGA